MPTAEADTTRKKRDAAFAPERPVTAVDIDAANARHGVRAPDLPLQILFTELGWAACRGGWIVKIFTCADDAHKWMERSMVRAA